MIINQESNEAFKRAQLECAFFFEKATEEETKAMVALWFARAGLTLGVNVPRKLFEEKGLKQFEVFTNEAEEIFMLAREMVRSTAAYKSLNPEQQALLEEKCMQLNFQEGER
jgi:hypothetical protein